MTGFLCVVAVMVYLRTSSSGVPGGVPQGDDWVTRLTKRASCAPSARTSTPTEPIWEMWLWPSDQITCGTVPLRANQAAVRPAIWPWLNHGWRSATAWPTVRRRL